MKFTYFVVDPNELAILYGEKSEETTTIVGDDFAKPLELNHGIQETPGIT